VAARRARAARGGRLPDPPTRGPPRVPGPLHGAAARRGARTG